MMPSTISPHMSVDEIMRRWPATIRVMIRHQMLCIGCPIGGFHTVADAAAAHSIQEAELNAELLDAMVSAPSGHDPSRFEANGLKLQPGDGDQSGV